MVDGDSYSTGHYGHNESDGDPRVGNYILQTREPSAVQIQEKGHCTQCQNCRACGHHNTVEESLCHFLYYSLQVLTIAFKQKLRNPVVFHKLVNELILGYLGDSAIGVSFSRCKY